jgi:hypothetical protein
MPTRLFQIALVSKIGLTAPTSAGMVAEVYVSGNMPARRLANIAFHEIMHVKLDVGTRVITDLHTKGGGGLATPPTNEWTPLTTKNIELMAKNLFSESAAVYEGNVNALRVGTLVNGRRASPSLRRPPRTLSSIRSWRSDEGSTPAAEPSPRARDEGRGAPSRLFGRFVARGRSEALLYVQRLPPQARMFADNRLHDRLSREEFGRDVPSAVKPFDKLELVCFKSMVAIAYRYADLLCVLRC